MEIYEKQPIIIQDFFDPETYKTILRFMDEYLLFMPLSSDRQEPDNYRKFRRRFAYNLDFFTDIHLQLVDYASRLFGQKLRPSYNFLSLYDNDGQCPLHLDIEQCRYTIDYLIKQEHSEPWPIAIGPEMSDEEQSNISSRTPQTIEERQVIISEVKWNTCLLNPNDAVCYSGTNAWHYRPTRSIGSVDLVFFHFVPESFSG